MRSTNALALLLVIAAAPFLVVLTACKGGDAAPSTPTASASAPSAAPSDSASNAVVNVAPADAAISSGGAAVTSASASASSSAHALTKREACERARNDFGATLSTHLSCHDDTDCATMYTGCGLGGTCGVAVAARSKSLLESKSRAFDALDCQHVLAPVPCPTCAMPPAPICKSGRCR